MSHGLRHYLHELKMQYNQRKLRKEAERKRAIAVMEAAAARRTTCYQCGSTVVGGMCDLCLDRMIAKENR